jgi:hypothetical protein
MYWNKAFGDLMPVKGLTFCELVDDSDSVLSFCNNKGNFIKAVIESYKQ